MWVILVGLVAVSALGGAVASYVMTSNTVTVIVNNAETLTLTSSLSTAVSGQQITLTATISDQRNGVVVTFYDNGVNVGQATSMGGGIATLTVTPAVGTHSYTATGLHP